MKQLEWEITDKVAIFHGRQGTNKIFGLDVDKRNKFSQAESKARFMKIWNEKLRTAVESATIIEASRAKERVPSKLAAFLRANLEQREFKLEDCEFVVQIQRVPEAVVLDQLWFIPSADTNPRALFIEFETAAEKQDFDSLAQGFGWKDGRELARKLILDFVASTNKSAPPEL